MAEGAKAGQDQKALEKRLLDETELEGLKAEREALLRGNAELRAHLRAVHNDRHHDFRRIVKEMGILNYENMEVSGELTFLRLFLARCKDSVVFDVGAYHGAYSRVVQFSCTPK